MIPLLNSAIPKLASPTSSSYAIMHNKFVVFDANNSNPNLPYVWSGSTNWTTAQIDGPDRNNVIVLQDQTLALAYTIEFEEMWGGSSATPNATTSKFGPYKANNTPHNFVIGGKTVESYFSPSDGTTSKIITALNSANSDIEIAVMNFTRSDISAALISSYSNGFTNINVLLDSSNPSGNQIGTLQTGLLPNHALVDTAPGIMHHKFMVVDNFDSTSDPLVLVGSHNWSTSAETKNDENTLIVHDANVTNQYFQAFASMYQIAGGTLSNLENTTDEKSILKIVPNPNNGIFDIVSNNTIEHLDLVVYDVLGKRIASKIYNSFYACSMDLSAESAGFYYIEATADGTIFHYKFIKK
jgi:phosphatidylserine/phosphatidylglycerophosphate/cardiolipin synthase-like enzyme